MTRRQHWVCASIRVGRGNLSIDLELSEPEPWMLDGLCAQVDPALWFPDTGGSTTEAKRICMSCPVRAECLQYALDHDEIHGIWGATSNRERMAMKPITSEEVRQRVADVKRLTEEGWSVLAIAVELGLSESTVRYDRKRSLEQHLEAS